MVEFAEEADMDVLEIMKVTVEVLVQVDTTALCLIGTDPNLLDALANVALMNGAMFRNGELTNPK